MVEIIDLDYILYLYSKYANDLLRVRDLQRAFYHAYGYKNYSKSKFYRIIRYFLSKVGIKLKKPLLNPQLDDIEAEITYLLIRELKPNTVVEISPCGGWSTSWILRALNDNEYGELFSYDLIDDSTKTITAEISKERWHFIQGDVRKGKIPDKIDYQFLDSEHSKHFAQWYIENIFPKVNGVVSIHDVFHTQNPASFSDEGLLVIQYLESKNIPYFTPSSAKNKRAYLEINKLRKKMGFGPNIHFTATNPMIFFLLTH